jgi:protein-disulfide isomerase
MKTAWLIALSAFALPTGMQCSGGDEPTGGEARAPEAMVAQDTPTDGCDMKLEDCDCDCTDKGRGADSASDKIDAKDFEAIAANDAPAFGPEYAPVTIVLFTDYQCPYCARLSDTLSKLRDEYGSRLRVVVRNLPLPMHDNARPAARAALAAAEQGQFESFETSLYANQLELDPVSLESLAGRAGLNETSFQHAMVSGSLDERIEHDLALAKRVGATGTPTLYINGTRMVGSRPMEKYRAMIDAELARLGR